MTDLRTLAAPCTDPLTCQWRLGNTCPHHPRIDREFVVVTDRRRTPLVVLVLAAFWLGLAVTVAAVRADAGTRPPRPLHAAVTAAARSGLTCAGISNRHNRAAWTDPAGTLRTARYSDRGDRLVYRPAPAPTDNAGWLALHTAESALTATGPAGPKLSVACVADPD